MTWNGYCFLNIHNSGYSHLSFNHGHGMFGEGADTTSHIESFWAFLKDIIKKLYRYIPSKGLYYFIK